MATTSTYDLHYRGRHEKAHPINELTFDQATSIETALSRIAGSASLATAPAASTSESGYPPGTSVYTAQTTGGWPTNGVLIVHRHNTTGRITQEITTASTGASTTQRYFRCWGSGPAWTAWTQVQETLPSTVWATSSGSAVFTNTSFSATSGGLSTCGTTFVAPPSGKVLITVGGSIYSATGGNSVTLSVDLRTGGTIGSGTQVLAPAANNGIQTSEAVNTGQVSSLSASRRIPVSGLTPGSTYNVRTMHVISPAAGNGGLSYREVIVEPVA